MVGKVQVFLLTLVDKGICIRHTQTERYMEKDARGHMEQKKENKLYMILMVCIDSRL